MEIFRWSWAPTPEEWQAFWSFLTLLVAGVAAWIALRQLRAHFDTQREQSRPYVIIDFAFRGSALLMFEVRNIGATAATNVKFKWNPDPVGLNTEDSERLQKALRDNPIPFLAPGRKMQHYVARGSDYWANKDTPNRFEVSASYSDLSGNTYPDGEIILDLGSWSEVTMDTDYENKNWNELSKQRKATEKTSASVAKIAETIEGMGMYFDQQQSVVQEREAEEEARAEALQKYRPMMALGERNSANDEPDALEPKDKTH